MEFIYIIGAIVAALVGFYQLEDGTRGIGLICLACFLVTVVRLLQADAHQKAVMEALKRHEP